MNAPFPPGGGLQTEIEFTLKKGYVDAAGTLHRKGRMRLATAADEILPQRDPRVQQNPAYLPVIVLSRVITELGTLTDIDVRVVEGLFASDFDQLQKLYDLFNAGDDVEPPAGAAEVAQPERRYGVPVLGEA